MADTDVAEGPSVAGRLLRLVGVGLALVFVAVATAVLALFYPLLRDDYQLDQAVRTVALDWRDFGEERARQRLTLEIGERGIQHDLGMDDCTFSRDGEALEVRCDWGVTVALPGGNELPLSFASAAIVDASGDLR